MGGTRQTRHLEARSQRRRERARTQQAKHKLEIGEWWYARPAQVGRRLSPQVARGREQS